MLLCERLDKLLGTDVRQPFQLDVRQLMGKLRGAGANLREVDHLRIGRMMAVTAAVIFVVEAATAPSRVAAGDTVLGGISSTLHPAKVLFVLVEQRQPMEQRLQHGGHVPPTGRIQLDALLGHVPDVLHQPFVTEIVWKSVHPFGEQAHEVGRKASSVGVGQRRDSSWLLRLLLVGLEWLVGRNGHV